MLKNNLFNGFLKCLVPISELNQGKASKLISDLNKDDVKIIVKNNEPLAAIISIERYSELIDLEDKVLNKNN